MLRLLTVLCLMLTAVFAQAQSDIELIFEADDFVGGMPVNQSGVIRFTAFNHGPDDVLSSQGAITIGGSYDRNVSELPIRYFSALTSNDPDCSITAISVDPPPPFIAFIPVFHGTVEKTIPVGSSVSCEFFSAIQYVDTVDIRWRISLPQGTLDPNMDNNTQQFTFRGLAASVPINNPFMLLFIVSLLLMTAWRYNLSKQN